MSELHAADLGLQAVEVPQLGGVGVSGLPQLLQKLDELARGGDGTDRFNTHVGLIEQL